MLKLVKYINPSYKFDFLMFSSAQMKKFHIDDPSDLCSIKISGQDLREVGLTLIK